MTVFARAYAYRKALEEGTNPDEIFKEIWEAIKPWIPYLVLAIGAGIALRMLLGRR